MTNEKERSAKVTDGLMAEVVQLRNEVERLRAALTQSVDRTKELLAENADLRDQLRESRAFGEGLANYIKDNPVGMK